MSDTLRREDSNDKQELGVVELTDEELKRVGGANFTTRIVNSSTN